MEDEIILVVEGQRILARKSSIALVSKFFKALFSHEFLDSHKSVLHLDKGGEMGLTVAAVKILAEFARTKQVKMNSESAVQIFIAGAASKYFSYVPILPSFHYSADALDVEIARDEAETFLGKRVLKADKVLLTVYITIIFTFCFTVGNLSQLLADVADFLHENSAEFPRPALSGELWLVLLQPGPGLVVSVHDSLGPQDSRRLPHWQEVQQL